MNVKLKRFFARLFLICPYDDFLLLYSHDNLKTKTTTIIVRFKWRSWATDEDKETEKRMYEAAYRETNAVQDKVVIIEEGDWVRSLHKGRKDASINTTLDRL